jgi:hypothetical protein
MSDLAAKISWLCTLASATAFADDARTLPQGILRMRLRPIASFASERWDQDGRAEALTHDLDRRELDSSVFPDLATLERVYGYQGGSLSIGTSHVEGAMQVYALGVAAELGITDRLSAGVVLPIVHGRMALGRVELEPETECTAIRCGIARNLGDTLITKDDSGYLPLDHDKDPSTRLATSVGTEDVQSILTDDLGYRRLESRSVTGIGDLELGLKYRLLDWGPYTTAVQGGVRFPTGRTDDPDDLVDVPFGDGQLDLGVAWQNDLVILDGLAIDATVRYTVQLPDRQRTRVPPRADVPIAKLDEIEDVYRDLGDVLEVDATLSYVIARVFTPFVRYLLTWKQKDRIDGERGLAYASLEVESGATSHILEAGLVFSTVPWVVAKELDLPFDASISFARSIAGRDNAPITNTVSLELAAYLEVIP